LNNKYKFKLFIFICLCLSLYYSNYYYGTENGDVLGGGLFRLTSKILIFILLLNLLKNKLKFTSENLILFLPIIIISIFPLIFFNYLEEPYKQAVNLVFFVPILFIDETRVSTQYFFDKLFKYSTVTIMIQVAIDFILLKLGLLNLWESHAFVGGFGNPSSFAYACLAGAMFANIMGSRFLSWFLLLAVSFTGAAAGMLYGIFFILKQVLKKTNLIIIVAISLIILLVQNKLDGYISSATSHAYNKLVGFLNIFFGNYDSNNTSQSISGRIEYYQEALKIILSSPASFLFGHGDETLYFTGDGGLIGYFATHGALIGVAFLIMNIYLIIKFYNSSDKLAVYSVQLIILTLYFLFFNRILDYYPIPLLYFSALSYLSFKMKSKRILSAGFRD